MRALFPHLEQRCWHRSDRQYRWAICIEGWNFLLTCGCEFICLLLIRRQVLAGSIIASPSHWLCKALSSRTFDQVLDILLNYVPEVERPRSWTIIWASAKELIAFVEVSTKCKFNQLGFSSTERPSNANPQDRTPNEIFRQQKQHVSPCRAPTLDTVGF
jgi:hypothetical protein